MVSKQVHDLFAQREDFHEQRLKAHVFGGKSRPQKVGVHALEFGDDRSDVDAARLGTSIPAIRSAARQKVMACTLEQMPQTRSIKVTSGTHSRRCANSSMPRKLNPTSTLTCSTVSATH